MYEFECLHVSLAGDQSPDTDLLLAAAAARGLPGWTATEPVREFGEDGDDWVVELHPPDAYRWTTDTARHEAEALSHALAEAGVRTSAVEALFDLKEDTQKVDSGSATRRRPPTERDELQWHLRTVALPEAGLALVGDQVVEATAGHEGLQLDGADIVIGHPDTGYTDHLEYVDPARRKLVAGSDVEGGDGDPRDPRTHAIWPGHGTRTGSLIAGGPAGLLEGVAPAATLMPVRVSGSVVHLSFAKMTRAVRLCHLSGCKVISISMGGASWLGFYVRALGRQLDRARQKGIIVIAAAGNHVGFVTYPASHDTVIAAAASSPDNTLWSGSSWGAGVDVVAPGDEIWLPGWEGNAETYIQSAGTSYSTAMVAGAAALWLQRWGTALGRYSPEQIPLAFRACLRKTAIRPLVSGQQGAGLLDVPALLREELPSAEKLVVFRAAPDRGERAPNHLFWQGFELRWNKDPHRVGDVGSVLVPMPTEPSAWEIRSMARRGNTKDRAQITHRVRPAAIPDGQVRDVSFPTELQGYTTQVAGVGPRWEKTFRRAVILDVPQDHLAIPFLDGFEWQVTQGEDGDGAPVTPAVWPTLLSVDLDARRRGSKVLLTQTIRVRHASGHDAMWRVHDGTWRHAFELPVRMLVVPAGDTEVHRPPTRVLRDTLTGKAGAVYRDWERPGDTLTLLQGFHLTLHEEEREHPGRYFRELQFSVEEAPGALTVVRAHALRKTRPLFGTATLSTDLTAVRVRRADWQLGPTQPVESQHRDKSGARFTEVPLPGLPTRARSFGMESATALRAAFAREDLPWMPDGMHTGGYGPFSPRARSRSVHRRRVRVAVLEQGDETLIWCLVDLHSGTQAIHDAVVRRLGVEHGALRVVGTHTHTGPCRIYGSSFYNMLAGGPLDPSVHTGVVNGIVDAVVRCARRAMAGLEDAELCWVDGAVVGLGRQRSHDAFDDGLEAKWKAAGAPGHALANRDDIRDWAVDARMPVLAVRRSGTEVLRGVLAFVACHNTAMGQAKVDGADFYGAAMDALETDLQTAVAMILPTTGGDVSPLSKEGLDAPEDHQGPKVVTRRACLLRTSVHAALASATGWTGAPGLGRGSAAWGPETPYDRGSGKLADKVRYGRPTLGGAEDGHSCLNSLGFKEGQARKKPKGDHGRKKMWYGFLTPILPAFDALDLPPRHPISVFRVGGRAVVHLPLEPTGTAGWSLEQAVTDAISEIERAIVVGYTDSYVGYLTTRHEYAEQHYEGSSTLYGPNTLDHVHAALVAALDDLEAVDKAPWAGHIPSHRVSAAELAFDPANAAMEEIDGQLVVAFGAPNEVEATLSAPGGADPQTLFRE